MIAYISMAIGKRDVFQFLEGEGGDLICNVDIDQISDDFTEHNEFLLTSEAVGTKVHLS